MLKQLHVSHHFDEKLTLAAMRIGLNMMLNDVRPGNYCSISCGFLSVAAVTEMKLQLNTFGQRSVSRSSLPFIRVLACYTLL